MKKEKFDNERVQTIINNEGIGYAVQHYCGHKDIADPEISKAWKKAAKALNHLEDLVKEKVKEEFFG